MSLLGAGLSTIPALAPYRFSVLRNLLPGWKRCLRLLETECFLLWGWFLQGSGEQRAEDAAAGDEGPRRQPVAWHTNLVGRLCQGLHCLSCLPAMLIQGTDLLSMPPQPLDHVTTLGGLAGSPTPASLQCHAKHSPWQTQCWWTVFTWPSRWSRASACPLRRGARPSYSRQSAGDRPASPPAPLVLGGKRGSCPLLHTAHHLLAPPRCPTGIAWQSSSSDRHLWWAGLWEIPSFAPLYPGGSQLCTAAHGHQPPHGTAKTWQRERTRSRLLLPHYIGLKIIKFFPVSSSRSSLELYLSPSECRELGSPQQTHK